MFQALLTDAGFVNNTAMPMNIVPRKSNFKLGVEETFTYAIFEV